MQRCQGVPQDPLLPAPSVCPGGGERCPGQDLPGQKGPCLALMYSCPGGELLHWAEGVLKLSSARLYIIILTSQPRTEMH